eukprot:jgi/Galph1/2915/GphlegSOOS_G1573.1
MSSWEHHVHQVSSSQVSADTLTENICVVGSLNVDLVATVPRIPSRGETILATSLNTRHGGKGANQAVASSRLGVGTSLIAKIGKDSYGTQSFQSLNIESVGTTCIETVQDQPTGLALILVESQTGENVITVVSGANAFLLADDVLKYKNTIASSSICMLQLEIPIATVEKTVEIANQHNVKVLLNPAPFQRLSDEILNGLDLLVPNLVELSSLMHMPTTEDWCLENWKEICILQRNIEKIQRQFPRLNLVVTLGKDGCLVCPQQNVERSIYHVEAFVAATPVMDTTGAGDCFCAALAVGILRYQTLLEAAVYATIAAGLSVTKLGAQSSYPTNAEVLALMKSSTVPKVKVLAGMTRQ